MKQVNNMSAGTIIPGSFCRISISKPLRISLKGVAEQISESLSRCRTHFISLAAVLLIGTLFLSGSYLFFVQLAAHGW
ncbi:MAG: hypothetical protein V2I35_10735 [Desulfocapsaceae bacterium]|jgi:hypothetical protein|nr:hypothetical protein [Desulfocapsaceae bacterium]